jgi:hypothetical protein
MRLMKANDISWIALAGAMTVTGCAHSSKPFIALGQHPVSSTTSVAMTESSTTMPATIPATASVAEPVVPPGEVATSDLGTINKVPGLAPKPKPFIAVPKAIQVAAARPSTLLLEHASPDSPVPLSEYARQPVYSVSEFHLNANLSAELVQKRMGSPAQLADCEDPWFVYRLHDDQEIWLHFSGPFHDHLDAADVIRGAEDGYVRTRVFSADDSQ